MRTMDSNNFNMLRKMVVNCIRIEKKWKNTVPMDFFNSIYNEHARTWCSVSTNILCRPPGSIILVLKIFQTFINIINRER